MITALIAAYIITNTVMSVRACRDDYLFRKALNVQQPVWHVTAAALLMCTLVFLPMQFIMRRRNRRANNK